jgi:tetratricopeptide (TPR) repeat protein
VRAEQLESAADLAWQLSDFETALEYSRQAVDLARQGGMHGRYPTYLNRLGRIYIQQGRLPEARQVLEECLNLSKRNPKSLNPGIPLAQLGEVALFEGRLEDANLILLQAFALLSGKDDIFMAMTTTDLAEIALAQGQHRQAKEWLRQALPYNQAHTRRTLVFLVAMAGTLIHSPTPHLSEVRVAVELLGAIQEISDRSSYFLAPYYAALLTERRRMARQHLSDAEFRRAQQAGRTLTQEQALHRAVQYL